MRRVALAGIPVVGFAYPLIAWFFYTAEISISFSERYQTFLNWYESKWLYWLFPIGWWIVGFIIRFYSHRYVRTALSNLKRKLRVNQQTDTLSDIRDEKERYKPKTFLA